MFWQVCCASDPSVICTGAARGLAVKAVWLHSVVSVWFSKTTSGGGCSFSGNGQSSNTSAVCLHSLTSTFWVICVCLLRSICVKFQGFTLSNGNVDVFLRLFLPCFRAQFDRQVPGWCAKQQRLRIWRASGKSDSVHTKQLLPFMMQTGNEKSAQSYILYVFFFFRQNYLSSRGKSWKDLRQEALQNVEQGKYYPAGKPARPHIWMIHMQHKRKNWVSAVLPLNKSNKSVCVRLSHLWKYHHVLGLRPASFEGPCLQIQTEHPFIRTARSNRIDVFSYSYSSPDINGAVCSFFFSFTYAVLHLDVITEVVVVSF